MSAGPSPFPDARPATWHPTRYFERMFVLVVLVHRTPSAMHPRSTSTETVPGALAVPCMIMQVFRQSCCDHIWVGPDRVHCCLRTGGCGAVFDDAELFDSHRDRGICVDPGDQDLMQTKNGIWLRAGSSRTG